MRNIHWINLLCLSITMNLSSVVCAKKAVYGIVLMKHPDGITAAGYSVETTDSKTIRTTPLTYKKLEYFGNNMMKCIERIQELTKFKDIPNDEIFLKVFKVQGVNPQTGGKEAGELTPAELETVESYYKLQNVIPIEIFTSITDDILIFGLTNVNIENRKLETTTTIIFRDDKLFLSFIASNTKLSSHTTTYNNVGFNAQTHTVFANSFRCATPLQVSHIIYEKLMSDSGYVDTIPHPCIPENVFIMFDPNRVNGFCVPKFGIDKTVKFIGGFDKDKCQNLIENAITWKGLKPALYKKCNFAAMALPLLRHTNTDIKLYTDMFKDLEEQNKDFVFIENKKQEFCSPDAAGFKKNHIDCLKIVYLEYLITSILGYKGANKIFIDTKFKPDKENRKVIFVDPRVGLTVENITPLFVPETSSIVSATVEISTQENFTSQIPTIYLKGRVALIAIPLILFIIWVGVIGTLVSLD